MKTIIVPLDFSGESMAGLNMSLMLAKKSRANIQMIHVIGKNTGVNDELPETENMMAKIKFEEILKKCQESGNIKCTLSYTIKEGKIFKEITILADRFEDSLIVLSTHGESGFEELFIGGNAYKIISHSKQPVITVRKNIISSNIDKIVLPLDITSETREKVPYTVRLAKMFNSEIHLLTVRATKIKSIEKKLHQYAEQIALYLNANKITYKTEHLYSGNLTDIILDYSESVNADLISIMSEQEKSVSNLLLGSYAHQMINKSTIPVLSFPTVHLGIPDDFRPSGVYYA